MRFIFLIPVPLAISILLNSCNDLPEKEICGKYRTGTFQYHVKMKSHDTYFLIIRNDSIQTEVNETTNDTSKFAIKWIGKCNYELRFLSGVAPLPDSLLRFKNAIVMKTEILEGDDNYYLFRSTSNMNDYVLQGTIDVKK